MFLQIIILQLKNFNGRESKNCSFSPREIVSELDRFVIGQSQAKRAVAIALRNRWRRQELPEEIKEKFFQKIF